MHDAVILWLSTPESRAMHAHRILHRCLASVLDPMHARRRRVLLQALQALIDGRRLTMTDLSRSWPGAMFSHTPLKAVDRLLSNVHVQQSILPLSRAMAAWLLSPRRPLVVVDWVDLQRDGLWCALRAAVPMQGRTVTVFERIYPIKQINSPLAERDFLAALAHVIPEEVRPILVTDAGFRSAWFGEVARHGWDYVGRIRNNLKVRPCGEASWRACSTLHAGARARAEDLGAHHIVQGAPVRCRLLRVLRPRKQREQLTRAGLPQQSTAARKARKAAREPWVLATSLSPEQANAAQGVTLYGKRMQIEESFRDLKSHRYGMGFEDSQTRDGRRLSVLLLLNMLAGFAAWLLGLALKSTTLDTDPLAARPALQGRYSGFRRAIEWLRKRVWPPPLTEAVTAMLRGWNKSPSKYA
jgi:hypothetical protein